MQTMEQGIREIRQLLFDIQKIENDNWNELTLYATRVHVAMIFFILILFFQGLVIAKLEKKVEDITRKSYDKLYIV